MIVIYNIDERFVLTTTTVDFPREIATVTRLERPVASVTESFTNLEWQILQCVSLEAREREESRWK